ncbi:MAG: AAA family ATPase, partial [Flavobacteriaceae bacterium]|nr:AAA family ATPase [Flavobacteriaceae bacterium]
MICGRIKTNKIVIVGIYQMYINSLYIEKYQILENLKMEFQIPKDNKNVVNIVAGVNGSGKTTLLKWILKKVSTSPSQKNDMGTLIRDDNVEITIPNWAQTVYHYTTQLKQENKYIDGIHSSPRIIYIPSNMTFIYQAKSLLDTSYKFSNTIDTNSLLGNAEFFIKEYVISKERSSSKANPKDRTKDAIDSFNAIFEESELITKLANLDIHNSNKPIFQTLNGDEVTIEKLSSGEQQLYARVVALMILNPHNSVILIDEPEIALHPKWQIDIMKIYANIGENNQFIVATHSPYIITGVPNKNINFLIREEGKIVSINDIVAYGRDIGWVLKEMGVPNTRLIEVENKFKSCTVLLDDEDYDKAEKC